MYLASKYEDIFPLHSKIVSEKIAHKAISPKDILKKESEFLRMFDFQIDFVTHFDFHQTYTDKLKRQLPKNICEN
jgi:23S rRNA maturation-related 3'-5' exoribonuclease YhaM